ncbi:MAG TPA: NADH-quinone oxidoreductase subunit NuoG [Fimbriimonadaceae bacterium]|nr:NADH-quinone oxidoreductase subunit NuoG [Fimbriimonadaceae bacterium]
MAAAVQVETVNITINDVEIAVPKGELIIESVKRLGLEIPIFCYHPRMKPVGMCRMCIIEVGFKQPDGTIRKMPKPQAACTLPASEGMAVYTDSEMVHRDRKGVLEFLLVNHPLDCPICDRGGECPLQNNTLFYGPSTSRFLELKRHAPKAFPLSKYVTLDLERCIQCGRCVRFTEEISGDAQLAFRFRGANMQPSTFELREFESKFSGNVIEICPVGALTSAKYRFRARPWDLETKPGICTICSNGCNIWFDYRVGKMVRINGRTNEAVNEEWTCDRGKFGHEFYNSDLRLTTPLVRKGDQLVEVEWARAYSDVIRAFSQGGDQVAILGGSENSNEDMYLARKLFSEQFKTENRDHQLEANLGPSVVNQTLVDLESAKSILVFGTSLADELPIVFLRVRKAWFNHGAKVVVAHDRPTDVDSFADTILRYRPGSEEAVAKALAGELSPEQAEKETGVSAAMIKSAMELAKDSVIITSQMLSDQHSEAVSTLERMGGSKFNSYSLRANDEGAATLFQGRGLNSKQILEAAAEGKIKALWLFGADPFESYPDRELVERALSQVDFLAFQGIRQSEAFHYASVVLPQTAPAEQEGTYTNCERRVQYMDKILDPKGDAKPAWRIFSEIYVRLKPSTPFFNPGEVMDQIAEENPAFGGAKYSGLPEEGFLIAN